MPAISCYIVGLFLLIVPGFWFAPLLRYAGFRSIERISLSVALGPVIVSMVMMGSLALGIPAQHASILAAAIGLFGFGWAVIELRNLSINSFRTIALDSFVLAIAMPFTWVIAFWLFVPGFRVFNCHALMQVDIINALARGPFPPEEPEMAGLVCSYSWFINLFWLAQSALTGLSPTIFVVPNNLVLLGAQVLLGFSLGRRSGLTNRYAGFSICLSLFGTGLIWIPLKLIKRSVSMAMVGQFTPLLAKYPNMDAMPFAFPLFTGLLMLAVRHERVAARDAAALFILTASFGFAYPALLPAAGCVIAAWTLRLALGFDRGRVTVWQMATMICALMIAFIAAIAGPAVLIKLVSVDRSGSAVSMLSVFDPRLSNKMLLGYVALGGLILLGSLAFIIPARSSKALRWQTALGAGTLAALFGGILLLAGLPVRLAFFFVSSAMTISLATIWPMHPTATLWLIGFGCLAFYVGFNVANLEYKYLLAANIALAPAAAAGLQAAFRNAPALGRTTANSIQAVLAAFMFFLVFVRGYHIPAVLSSVPVVAEQVFPMELDPAQPEWGWVSCVRAKTPPETIVVSRNDPIHVSAFLDRSMFLPSGGDAGYLLDHQYNMTHFRGHAASLYEARAETIRQLYCDASMRGDGVAELIRLGRPVALHLKAGDQALRTWLLETKTGQPLRETADDALWLIPIPVK